MSVDARMLVRIKGRDNWLPDEDELATAYELATTIGADNFYITVRYDDGRIPPDGHHALTIMRPVRDSAEAKYRGLPDTMIGRTVWTQDGEPIVATDDEQFIKVHIDTRYFSPGYARGNWPAIRMTIEWLQLRFPAGTVWYGGDSGGIEPMTGERLTSFNEAFLQSSGRTYHPAATSSRSDDQPPVCPCCLVETDDLGTEQGYGLFLCDGCGQKFIKEQTGGRVHVLGLYADFSVAAGNLRAGRPARADAAGRTHS